MDRLLYRDVRRLHARTMRLRMVRIHTNEKCARTSEQGRQSHTRTHQGPPSERGPIAQTRGGRMTATHKLDLAQFERTCSNDMAQVDRVFLLAECKRQREQIAKLRA